MARDMKTIWIDKDELYPVYLWTTCASNWYDAKREISTANLIRCEEAWKEWSACQELLTELYKEEK